MSVRCQIGTLAVVPVVEEAHKTVNAEATKIFGSAIRGAVVHNDEIPF